MTFKIGDAVQLKGGSPIMTVTALSEDLKGNPRVTCIWFDSQQNEKSGDYPVEALTIYEDEEPTEPEDD
jgi:uncharacterized protein YodC (DUF2158 family)